MSSIFVTGGAGQFVQQFVTAWFSQVEFAERIDIFLDTIRNLEQGKRCPSVAIKMLMNVLVKTSIDSQ